MLAPLLAVVLLLAGTVVFCVSLALVARVVDRLWDLLAPASDEQERRPKAHEATIRVGNRPGSAVPRVALVAALAAALLAALGWLAFVLGRSTGIE